MSMGFKYGLPSEMPCNFIATSHNDAGYSVWDVTVTGSLPARCTKPSSIPVTVGTAVKADGSNGVLTPTSFAVGSTATELTSLEWSNNEVVLTLDTHVSLSGLRPRFHRALDGSVSLSLFTDSATVDSTAGTYSWPMTDSSVGEWGPADAADSGGVIAAMPCNRRQDRPHLTRERFRNGKHSIC